MTALNTESKVMRTPEERFEGLPDYPFAPHYVEVSGGGAPLRMHYLDERPADPAAATGETVLLLHGNPSWSYLWRHVVPPLVAAGHRVVAPDLIGMGKSDKPASRFAYTYQSHLDWLREAVFERLELTDVTLVCHDWGGGLGLPLVADEPGRFRRVVATNTGLSTGDEDLGPAWPHLAAWLQMSQREYPFHPGGVVEMGTAGPLDPGVRAAYEAPFPGEEYLAGVRQFPLLLPITPNDEATPALREAWKVLETLHTPFLCAFSDQDHVFGGDHSSLSGGIPGAAGQPHTVIEGGGHFIQEDRGEELAAVIVHFINTTVV